jgi:hypothetical protein
VGGTGGENDHDSDAPLSRSNSETHLLAGEGVTGAGSVTSAGESVTGGHGSANTGSAGNRDKDIEVGGLQQQQRQQEQQRLVGGISSSRSGGGLSARKA